VATTSASPSFLRPATNDSELGQMILRGNITAVYG
jgi:hypothetical protein